MVDDSFVLLVNADHEDVLLPAAGAALRQPVAPGDLDGRARRARGLAQLAGALRGRRSTARSLLAAAPGLVRAHLPPPARPGPRLRRRPRAGPLPRASWASATSTSRPSLQARPGSTHGYDVIDPRRISDDLGGEAAFRALAGAGLDVLLDIVPNHMAASDENPFWADPALRERYFDIDPRHRAPPALLLHRRAGRACAWRTRRSSRPPTPWCCAWWRRASSTACASTTPTASPTPAGTCAG